MALPLKLFELSDVVLMDANRDVGARNERRLAALYYGKTSGFEYIHGLLDRVMQLLDNSSKYSIEEAHDPMFFPGRCAQVVTHADASSASGDNVSSKKVLGMFGILHPNVLKNFDLSCPCSVLEMNIEPFV